MKKIRLFLKRIFEKMGATFFFLSRKIYQTQQEKRTILWYKNQDEKDIRFIFDLNQNSIVFDVGGYEGQWTSDIYSMYSCYVFVFEPVCNFANNIKKRFLKNEKITVCSYGLTSKDEERDIFIEGDKSSSHHGKQRCPVRVKDISSFIDENKISNIDLIKINIEGDEYDLLERMIETKKINMVKNILVQFHDFVPHAIDRMVKIKSNLSNTHKLVYGQDFVWERWVIK